MNFENTWYILGVILTLTVCSILTRGSYLVLGDYIPLSDRVRRALRYAPVAALVGIVVPELLPWQPGSGIVFDARALAAIVAIIMFMRTGSTMLLIVGGMIAFWILRFLLSVSF